MLSDEEKKAMKYFYNLRATIDESNMLFDEDIDVKCGKETIKQITTILNLIEKQSKQIKELKENNKKYIVQLTDEQYRKLVDVIRAEINKEWIDKINLKIEELYETKQYWNNEVIKILNKIKGDEN